MSLLQNFFLITMNFLNASETDLNHPFTLSQNNKINTDEFSETTNGNVRDTGNLIWEIIFGDETIQKNVDGSKLTFNMTKMKIEYLKVLKKNSRRLDDDFSLELQEFSTEENIFIKNILDVTYAMYHILRPCYDDKLISTTFTNEDFTFVIKHVLCIEYQGEDRVPKIYIELCEDFLQKCDDRFGSNFKQNILKRFEDNQNRSLNSTCRHVNHKSQDINLTNVEDATELIEKEYKTESGTIESTTELFQKENNIDNGFSEITEKIGKDENNTEYFLQVNTTESGLVENTMNFRQFVDAKESGSDTIVNTSLQNENKTDYEAIKSTSESFEVENGTDLLENISNIFQNKNITDYKINEPPKDGEKIENTSESSQVGNKSKLVNHSTRPRQRSHKKKSKKVENTSDLSNVNATGSRHFPTLIVNTSEMQGKNNATDIRLHEQSKDCIPYEYSREQGAQGVFFVFNLTFIASFVVAMFFIFLILVILHLINKMINARKGHYSQISTEDPEKNEPGNKI
ncbi:putative SP-containing membrane protein [Vairimorpha necatrix]|uniref:SP-containing membrane protein n=1 Tax=Vairimorpha necatrix TaxID=6039 RepID=A0AAX4JEM1_9MICR